ncbi:MAG: efflux RND transporter periplasmic adaptor subunit [Spirochaetales bacterium]|nr:efflux RND transporter periplasmic adaptor subunit [Spirochaetales bacterium]
MKKNIGNRIVQILLLLIIAAIGAAAVLTLKPSAETAQGGPGGMPPGITGGQAPGGRPGGPGNAEESLIAVESEKAARRDITQSIKVNGDVITNVSVKIYSDIGGIITSKSVSVGDYIRKGEVIAKVNPSVPGQVYSSSSVISTISGTITTVYTSVGDTINTQTPVVTIGDLSKLLIQTHIPEKFVSVLKPGLKAKVGFDAFPEEIFYASITEISPVMNPSSRTIEIKLSFDDPEGRIKAGMFARISLITKASYNTVSIPSSAVFSYYNQDSVYLIVGNEVKRQAVRTGLKSDEYVEILEGLNEEDKVVTQGINNLTDGSKIRMVESGEKQ